MYSKLLMKALLLLIIVSAGVWIAVAQKATGAARAVAVEEQTPGALQAVDASGKPKGVCPLQHTDVKAEISGFLSRVRVTQQFANPFPDKIEAVYTFPLPQNAAVDDMTMTVGERTVRGKIMRREQAQAVYQAAKNNGQVVSLLDQERPNIFTQSVANIMPGEKVTVVISYVETLKYEDGAYEFVFPMVVGPRYVPGARTGQQGGGFAPDTTRVPDGSRITPQVAARGKRAGHDISIEVALDSGVPLDGLKSDSHEVEIERSLDSRAVVRLKDSETIPNKDFILRYDVAGRKISDALLTHRSSNEGFFTFILQPPERVTAEDVTPKEIVFVLDTSGSMSGFPIEKAKEAMKLALDGLYPQDTFNLITFAGDTSILFPKPVPATPENLRKAQKFLESREGAGGTEMMTAIRAALDPSDAQDHIRIVCFMTDGYVGDDMTIISEVQKHPNARVFSFGIGSSVNRFLLDKMAEYGRGEVEYVSLTDDGSAAAKKFHERVRSPLLTDISIDWGGLQVADVYPARIPDLFSAKPVVLTGRYTRGGKGVIKLKGKMSGRDYEREIAVELPEKQEAHDVLATLWARERIDDLMGQDYAGAQHGQMRPELQETVTQLGLEYRLMTQFTSFVAVEEMTVTDGGVPRRVDVPVELPEGVSRQGVFGEDGDANGYIAQLSAGRVGFNRGRRQKSSNVAFMPNSPPVVNLSVVNATDETAVDKKSTYKTPVSGGVLNGKAVSLPKPEYPESAKAARTAGQVSVQVTIDESGNVISAKAVSGNPLLQAAAIEAARKAKFTPTQLSGQPVKTTGIVTYTFDPSGRKTATTVATLSADAAIKEEEKHQQLLALMHPSIVAVIERLARADTQAGADEAKFIRDGKAEVQIWLTDKTPEAIAQLKALGLEVVLDPKAGKLVIGRMPIENLAKLADLKFVRYVAPQPAGS